MLPRVKELVGVLSSPRHLLADLTLPILSVFSGKGLDAILRKTLGEDDVEDLWLPFFCCSTNLTRGRLSTHVAGRAWRRVRASMTTLGLLPPVVDERGELLVDGGYLNAIPADVMRETMGADVVIVVDVEDDDYLAFRDLTPRDGGLGGWRLLWERVDPLAGARATARDAMRGARDALQKTFPSVFSIRAVARGRFATKRAPRRVGSHRERRGTSRDVANVRLVRQPFKRAAPRDVVAASSRSLARARHRPVPAPARGQRLDRAAHARRVDALVRRRTRLLRRRRGLARARGARPQRAAAAGRRRAPREVDRSMRRARMTSPRSASWRRDRSSPRALPGGGARWAGGGPNRPRRPGPPGPPSRREERRGD